MSSSKSIWKVWLRLNRLTKDVTNDYIAEVSTVGNTLRNEDIAKHIVKERSELRYETLLSVLNERDSVVRDALLGGSSVQDGNVHLAPRITGNWIGADPVFDPKSHKITVDATSTGGLRKALEEVGVEVLGKKTDGGAIIGLVTDVVTGKTDGTVFTAGDIIIEGTKIKIEPANDTTLGVFFINSKGAATPLDFPMTENNPSRIVCRIPAALTVGQVYTLRIVTRFTNGNVQLKQARTLEYELPLKVVKDKSEDEDA